MQQRSTSRTTALSKRHAPIVATLVLYPLLLIPAPSLGQSALQPPPQSDSQTTAPDTQPAPTLVNPQDDQSNPLHTASRTELDVVKVLVAQEKAWNAGDVVGFIKAYKDSPDTIFIGRQLDRGYQQILEDYERNYPTRASMGNLTYSELEVTELSETFAVCTGKYHVDRNKKEGGPADGLFSLALEKTAQGWKIVLDHTT